MWGTDPRRIRCPREVASRFRRAGVGWHPPTGGSSTTLTFRDDSLQIQDRPFADTKGKLNDRAMSLTTGAPPRAWLRDRAEKARDA
jgi:hypothetical protein